jgi:hypothetical protein
MSDWFYNLPVPWMALVVFALMAVVTWLIYAIVMRLAIESRTRAFKGVTSALLSPLGVMFGLLVVFLSAQVWNDSQRAGAEVSREASALRSVDLLAAGFSDDLRTRVHALLSEYVQKTVQEEWPAMSRQGATLAVTSAPLSEALRVILAAVPDTEGQRIAQREMVKALETVLDARRQRIIISRSSINGVKWAGLFGVAIVGLIAIAMVHVDNKGAAANAMALFAMAVAISVVLIASHARPFTGQISVGPGVLQEVIR